MNVTAFSLKFCQCDIVPWCNLSQHLDLICALLHNSLQKGLGPILQTVLQMRKVIPTTAYRLWHPAVLSEHRAEPPHPGEITWKWWPFPNFTWPQRQCLISLYYSESRWTTGKESRDLLKTQLLLLSLDFPGQYISIFFHWKREQKTSLFHAQS